MAWAVEFQDDFVNEYRNLAEGLRRAIVIKAGLLEREGPELGRPYADTLSGSKYTNMKELRFNYESGVWRIAYAFDSDRKCILLVAGNKVGKNQRRFYRELIAKADRRFQFHLKEQETKND